MVFIILNAFGLLSVSHAADAPQRAQMPRVVVLRVDSLPQWGHNAIGGHNEFLQGLRELGYMEGQNIALEIRWAEVQFERLPALVAELVSLLASIVFSIAQLTPSGACGQASVPSDLLSKTLRRRGRPAGIRAEGV